MKNKKEKKVKIDFDKDGLMGSGGIFIIPSKEELLIRCKELIDKRDIRL